MYQLLHETFNSFIRIKKEKVMNQIIKSQNNAIIDPTKETRAGFEIAPGQDDLIIPRARLLQSKSPEVEEPQYEGRYRAGMVINSLTKDVIAPPGIFIPIFWFPSWARFNPKDKEKQGFDPAFEKGAMIWKTNDPNDPRTQEAEFGPNGEKPIAIKSYNFFSYVPGQEMPIIIPFMKTSAKAGKQLLSLAMFSKGGMYTRKYKLTSSMKEKDGDKYYVLEVLSVGLTDKSDLEIAESWHRDFRARSINVHAEETTSQEFSD